MSVAAPSDWADHLRTPPFEVLHAWTETDADPSTPTSAEDVLTVWNWLASVLPDAVNVDTSTSAPIVHIGVIWLYVQPVPHPELEDAGWPAGASLVVSGPGVSAVALPGDDGPGWVISRGDDPELPTLVAAAPTVATLHRELAHRVWHRCVDLLMEAGDALVDPREAAVSVHADIVSALSRGWREELLWIPAITQGHREWSIDLAGVPTGSWLDAAELPQPYHLEMHGSVLRARPGD